MFVLGAEEKTNVELIVPIGSVVIAMFFWLLVVFVIRGRKRVRASSSSAKSSFLGFIQDRLKHTDNENTHSSTHTVGLYDGLKVTCLAQRLLAFVCGDNRATLISHVRPHHRLGPFLLEGHQWHH